VQSEIVTIGTELLLGEILDTNSAWIAQRLTTIGLNLYYTTTVGDNLQRITAVLRQSLDRSEVVITTGGLGPTVDDMTRDAVAAATDRELYLDQDLVEEITAYFGRRRSTMTDNNRKQANLPRGARVIHNPVGTAPAFLVEHKGHVMISLPGVPHEMQFLMEKEVLPFLRERFGLTGIIKSRTVHSVGLGESAVDARIGDLMQLSNPTVGTRAHLGQTDVVITAKADTEADADALIAPVEADLRGRLGIHVYGADQETMADVITGLLAVRGMRLAVAETTTRGDLAKTLTTARDGARALAGTVMLPHADAARQVLNTPAALIAEQGFASQAVADDVAEAVRRLYGASLGLAIVGPEDPGVEGAPPVHFSLATGDGWVRGQPRAGRAGVAGMGWLMFLAQDLVRRHLLGAEPS
jgi:nicotinamide-nucleotide amidase